MEISRALLLLGNTSSHSGSHDGRGDQLGLLPTSRLLSLRLWFLPIWVLRFLPIWVLRFLLDIRSLLVHQMGFLAVARVRSATVLEIRRPSLLHPKGTIC